VFRTAAPSAVDSITRATSRLRRAGRDLHRSDQCPQQPGLLRDISATNPCGEEPLPPYGACLLGSINLQARCASPFTPAARIDEDELAGLVRIAVRMMDNTIDVSRFRLEEQEAFAKRRIGLGVTGLADALIMIGLPLRIGRSGRPGRAMGRAHQPYRLRTSAGPGLGEGGLPAVRRGAYPCRRDSSALPDDIRDRIAAGGIRMRCSPRSPRPHDLPVRRQRLQRHRAGILR